MTISVWLAGDNSALRPNLGTIAYFFPTAICVLLPCTSVFLLRFEGADE